MRITSLSTLGAIATLGFFLGCGGSKQAEPAPAPASEPQGGGAVAPADAVAAQIQQGQALYGQHCAKCHGDGGQGTDQAPPVVGMAAGALPLDPRPTQKFRTTQFKTAMDVAQFVVANMPPKGDKLQESEYWAVLAFDLHANGVKLQEPVGPGNAASFVLHP